MRMHRGKAFVYGDNVNTDVIIPARYLSISEPSELAQHCMEDLDPQFRTQMAPGDIMVGGTNFGCGSSREHAPLALQAAGVSCVIAATFARIFYRNAINIGLPILECPEAAQKIASGDELEVDLGQGRIFNRTKQETYQAKPYPEFMLAIMAAGGLIEMVKAKIAAQRGA